MRLIDADALIHAIRHRAADIIFRGCQTMLTGKDSCNPAEWTRGYEQGVMDTVNMMGTQNIIEAEPVRHGRWEMRSWNGALAPFCTVCNTVPRWPFHRTTRCPNCGAKMDGDNHEP